MGTIVLYTVSSLYSISSNILSIQAVMDPLLSSVAPSPEGTEVSEEVQDVKKAPATG